ncbi:MAG TPA: hypothetical protein VEW28_07565, partial [Candidatus Kapabacteria bacterium]|nr:hypothetical protein [Candidatus Kapabacteria bacterium]
MRRIGLCFLATLFLVIALSKVSRAQPVSGGLNADGRDFYLGLLYPSYNSQPINLGGTRNVLGFYGVYALVSSYTDNQVVVSYFDYASGNEINKTYYNVAARRAVQIPLDVSHIKMDSLGEEVEWKACHITSKKPVNVQFFSTGANSGGSYLALPTNVLGKEYVVEAYHDNVGGVGGNLSNEDASGYFMVIAAFDGTTVNITPSSTTKRKRPGVFCGDGATGKPQGFQIGLNRGQCYMVKSAATDYNCNISGSTVEATKPVAVIAGHEDGFTDGGDASPGGSRGLEARDYMIEQMIPVEQWDSVGLVSIPFIDSQSPAPGGGNGDEYDFFTGIIPHTPPDPGPQGSSIHYDIFGWGAFDVPGVGPYSNPIPNKIGVLGPINAYSTNGTKIHMAQYDQRMQGGGQPFPAPGQMSIVPMSRWKSSYLFYVPSNTFEILQGYYINVICDRNDFNVSHILVSINGSKPIGIQQSGLAVKKKWGVIPGYPNLVGLTFSVSPGAYYLTGDSLSKPFMVYNYGFRAIDPDRDLGDFCGDDHFFQYSLPVGYTFKSDSGALSITVDTLCAKWYVCVHDGRKVNPGIKSVQIMDDPNGDILRPPQVYHNVLFDPNNPDVNPDNLLEIDLQGNDTLYCFDVEVANPLDTGGAYGPVYILDNIGNGYLVKLNYKPPKIKLLVRPNYPNQLDSIVYPRTLPGTDTCATVYYYNAGAKTDPAIQITGASLKRGNPYFTITGTSPATPTSLKPGDTLAVTVCFDSKDTLQHLDSLILQTSCFKAPLTLVGPGGTPLIYATDHDYKQVVVNSQVCDTVSVTNVGTMSFTITGETLHDPANFTFDAAASPTKLPATLKPGQRAVFTFCFNPTAVGFDSTWVDWQTDMKGTYKDSIKAWSYLRGTGIKPGVVWDRITQFDTTICDQPFIRRVNLISKAITNTDLFGLYFDGPDYAEYVVDSNQVGYTPLADKNNTYTMKRGDTIWVEYTWKPDLTKTPKFGDRHT